jgi:hypothetical protein
MITDHGREKSRKHASRKHNSETKIEAYRRVSVDGEEEDEEEDIEAIAVDDEAEEEEAEEEEKAEATIDSETLERLLVKFMSTTVSRTCEKASRALSRGFEDKSSS